MDNIYAQSICADCLQMLANGESDHSPQELEHFQKVLHEWVGKNYIPAGQVTDENGNCEPYFSWHRCDLCDGLPGNRYDFNFIDKSETI